MPYQVDIIIKDEVVETYGPYYSQTAACELAEKESRRWGLKNYAVVKDKNSNNAVKVFERGHEVSLRSFLING